MFDDHLLFLGLTIILGISSLIVYLVKVIISLLMKTTKISKILASAENRAIQLENNVKSTEASLKTCMDQYIELIKRVKGIAEEVK